MHSLLKGAAGAFFCLCLTQGCREFPPASKARGAWGVDACLTSHVNPAARAAYLPQLREAGIMIVRERAPNPAMAELHEAGFKVVSFLGMKPLPDPQPGDALPDDLLAVFSAAKVMQQTHGRYVDTWEMINEPDVGYCRDLPDRVAAFQKAVYLGIKSESERESEGESDGEGESEREGGRVRSRRIETEEGTIADGKFANKGKLQSKFEKPLVLMGALALPPGPWLDRAARNGLLDYTDAYDFHFYGFAEDLAGVIRAHEAFASKWVDLRTRTIVGPDLVSAPIDSERSARKVRPYDMNGRQNITSEDFPISKFHLSSFPIWITECGINTVVRDDFLNPARRQLQADFTLATARQAQASESVAVFMPFVLVEQGDPYALTLAPDRPLPAWTAYADHTRRHPFPSRTLAMPPRSPNPVVVQWLPDNRTAIPHKVSGCYRFWQDQPMHGALRIYNFSSEPVHGTMEAGALRDVALGAPDLHAQAPATDNTPGLPAFCSSTLTIPALGRIDLPITFTPITTRYFRDFLEASFIDEYGRRSPVYFGLETIPDEDDFVTVPLKLGEPAHGLISHPDLDGTAVTSQNGAWTGINGLVINPGGFGNRPHNQDSESKIADDALLINVSLKRLNNDPLWPPVAIARVKGLPQQGFLRMQLDRPMDSDFGVRVDLIDAQGQRFTVWENLGASYFGPRDDVWMNLEDFHIYFWGRCSEHPIFRPQDIDEIRLRFYFTRANESRSIRLSFVQLRTSSNAVLQP